MDEGTIALEQWRAWRREGYNSLPLVSRLPLGEEEDRPADWLGAWQAASPHAIILESGKDGRYTYLGLRPTAVLRGRGHRAEVTNAASGETATLSGKPLAVVRAWLTNRKAPALSGGPEFTGGIAGMWSYDIVRSLERLPEMAADDLGLPDYLFLQLDKLWIVDHKAGELVLACHTEVAETAGDDALADLYLEAVRTIGRMEAVWRDIRLAARSPEATSRLAARRAAMAADRLAIDVEMMDLIRPFDKQAYMDAVERIRGYIARGDVFQVNLTQRMSKPTPAEADALYEWLRLFNPSPYMGYLRCPDFGLVSASPELLVKMRRGRLATRPIGGTRRRGRTDAEDRRLAADLLANEKERAEHIMLVDLERNDFGRIAKTGTVRVPELMTIEYYSHVMHLVSQVEAELAAGKDGLDVIAAVFPGGTITGAPKIRTMEIVEELEPTRRGPFYGSLGWIDYGGDMEFNILIRTMVVKDGVVHVQAGGGVVIDSDPEQEYAESLNKAKALWKAVQYVERETAVAAAGRNDGHDFGHR